MGYFPNGTAGEMYEAQYCCHCIHQNGPDGESGCAIWLAHLLYNYDECNNDKSILHILIPKTKDGLGNERCMLFRPKPDPKGGEPVPELTEADKKYLAWQQQQRTNKTSVSDPANSPRREAA